jgi:hypothetical protein
MATSHSEACVRVPTEGWGYHFGYPLDQGCLFTLLLPVVSSYESVRFQERERENKKDRNKEYNN